MLAHHDHQIFPKGARFSCTKKKIFIGFVTYSSVYQVILNGDVRLYFLTVLGECWYRRLLGQRSNIVLRAILKVLEEQVASEHRAAIGGTTTTTEGPTHPGAFVNRVPNYLHAFMIIYIVIIYMGTFEIMLLN